MISFHKVMKQGDLILFEELYDNRTIIESEYAILLEIIDDSEWGLCKILTQTGEILTVSSIWLKPI